MKIKENILAIILAGLIAFLYISGIPAVFFINIHWQDVDPVCIALFINIIIVLLMGLNIRKIFLPSYIFGYQKAGFLQGCRRYGISCALAFVIPFFAFFFGLRPFNYMPTIWKVLIEGVLYYIGVGMMEEFFCRGLLQNALKNMAHHSKHAELIAVMIASTIFGAGHFFGMIGMAPLLIVCKLMWAVGLGIYLGAVYVKTNNLWLVSFFHFVIDLCGLPFCFSTQKSYPTGSAIIVLIAFVLLGIYGVALLLEREGVSIRNIINKNKISIFISIIFILVYIVNEVTGDNVVFHALSGRCFKKLNGEVYRIITASFLHTNLLHLSANIIALVSACYYLERMLGPGKLLLTYMSADLLASVFFMGT